MTARDASPEGQPARQADADAHAARKRAALAQAVAEFNAGEFYECHETLEVVWLEESGEDHRFLQGLIQAAAAYHNLLRGKDSGGLRLLVLALEKLGPFEPCHLGVDVTAFRAGLRAGAEHLRAMQRGGRGRFDAALIPRLQLDSGTD
jgi:predicted metal-dependent hydrolase